MAYVMFINRDIGLPQGATAVGKVAAGNNITMAGNGTTDIGTGRYKSAGMQL